MKSKIKRKAGRWYIGYKCVTIMADASIVSYNTARHPVEYALRRRTNRPQYCGALAAFKTLEEARDFSDTPIYKCRYRRSATRRLFVGNAERVILRKQGRAPEGTDYADAIVLLERVQ